MKIESQRRGFSLLELLITTGVVALGLLALLSVLAFSAKASRTSEMASLAAGYSVHVIELIRSRNLDFSSGSVPPSRWSGLNDAPEDRQDMNAPPFQADFEPELPFKRNISIERLGEAGQYNQDVVNITVSIYWHENGEDRSVTFVATHKRP